MNQNQNSSKQNPGNITIISLLIAFIILLTIYSAFSLAAIGRENIPSRIQRVVLLDNGEELKSADDGEYLVHGFLRGSEVIYDDNGHAVVYLERREKTKEGNSYYKTIFRAERFYIDDIPIPKPELHDLAYPDFDRMFGKNIYKGLYHCSNGTFLVTKENGKYLAPIFFTYAKPQAIYEKYIGNSVNIQKFMWIFPVVGDIICIALLVVFIRRMKVYVCPCCGRQLKRNSQCPHCLADAVEKKKQSPEPAAKTTVERPKPKDIPEKEIKKFKRKLIIGGITIVVIILLLVSSLLRDNLISHSGIAETYVYRPDISENVYNEYPYEYVDAQDYMQYFDNGGEHLELTLPSGKYIVGVNIPQGRYTVEAQDDFDVLIVTDHSKHIYIYDYAAKENNRFDDLRLFIGAEVEIRTEGHMTLRSEHALTEHMDGIRNPLTESVKVQPHSSLTAGRGYAPGIYDISFGAGDYSVYITIDDPHSDDDIYYEFTLSGDESAEWKNIVLPEGAKLEVTDGSITLTPSPTIFSTCYTAYYELYRTA